ncbi:MAG: hypothetical protein ABIP51_11610 [Bacteroidia bacterium]
MTLLGSCKKKTTTHEEAVVNTPTTTTPTSNSYTVGIQCSTTPEALVMNNQGLSITNSVVTMVPNDSLYIQVASSPTCFITVLKGSVIVGHTNDSFFWFKAL